MDRERRFAPIARALRDGIVDHYRDRGESIDHVSGRRTLDTNSTLAAERAELILGHYFARSGRDDITGLRIADLGCGFGSLGLYFAAAGAQVVAIDPNADRFPVSAAIATRFGLDATYRRGWVEELGLPDAAVDLAVMNNSLCYIVDRADRRSALRHVHRVLAPGGWTVLRNPSRSAPVDPFTGRPFVHRLPIPVSRALMGERRSHVRLLTARAARRELRRAGFADVRSDEGTGLKRLAGRYQHLTGRRMD